jgi:two-component system, OmpR family, sensor histidine kinase KdpD
MNEQRPDPDELLRRIREQEERERRAKLKIFFGASAGVGKTYAMLVEAHERRRAGVDVVVGVVETHGRAETAALLEGLEVLSPRLVEYRGAVLREFDLDAALARHPGLLLMDELAHTNAQGSRHAKRWLDVEELLAAGIDVYTTLNVQHVESLYDVVAQITGVAVREIVPDSILERADEIELVDLPPDDLLQRLREGRVYIPEQAARATEHFFKKGNLIALRELALRVTAHRVDQQMESYRREHAIRDTWAVGGRFLVGLGEPEAGLRLIRAASRMAARLQAEWLVVHVETPGEFAPTGAARDHLVDLMGYAEELGAETAMLIGTRVADQMLAYARERNVSRIIVGKPTRSRWFRLLRGSLVDALLAGSGEIDVFVMSGESEEGERRPAPPPARRPSLRASNYVQSLLAVALCTGIAWVVHLRLPPANLPMIYLLGIMAVAMRLGRGPALLASVLSVVAFDFFFVPPTLAMHVSDTQYLLTFAGMLVVALVISTMASRLRQQADAAREREHRTAALYLLSRELSSLRGTQELLHAALRRVTDLFGSRGVILLPDAAGRLSVAAGEASLLGEAGHDQGVAQWTFDHSQPAGAGTPTLPAAGALFLPLLGARKAVGVLGIVPDDPGRVLTRDRFRLAETFASQVALSLERAQLAEQAERTHVLVESERTRSLLLSSVSHDLRTPLSVITGATSSLLADGSPLPGPVRRELVETIAEEAQRLNRLVGNLLDMTRLESGAMPVRREWHSLEEVVGSALGRLESRLEGREVAVRLAPGLPLVLLDDVLIELVLFNLVENALKYTPPGSPIEIAARLGDGALLIEVADRGPGLPPGQEESVFEKFYRGRREGDPSGVGLGLSICRGIIEAHGGAISAANREGGGAVFRVMLRQDEQPPAVTPEEAPGAGDTTGLEPS